MNTSVFLPKPNVIALAVHGAVQSFRLYPLPPTPPVPPALPPAVVATEPAPREKRVRSTGTTITEKTCTRCRVTKPLAEFRSNKNSRDGYSFRCKACFANRVEAPEIVSSRAHSGGVARSSWQVQSSLDHGERHDGKLLAHTDICRTGIVPRGPVSTAIAGYLSKVAA